MERKGPHKYNTRSSTKRFNHVITFKTAPNMFKKEAAENITTHKVTDYLARIDPKNYSITVEPIANHIKCETSSKILWYREIVKMDAPLWTNSMCNEIRRLSQVWKNMREQT